MHKVIQFNQKAWLKPYIGMNTRFFKLMNNSVFGKTMKKRAQRY